MPGTSRSRQDRPPTTAGVAGSRWRPSSSEGSTGRRSCRRTIGSQSCCSACASQNSSVAGSLASPRLSPNRVSAVGPAGLLHDAQERRVARGAGGREDRRRVARGRALVEERLEARGVGAMNAGERGTRPLDEHRRVQGIRSWAIDARRDRSEPAWDEPVPRRLIVAERAVVDGLPGIDHAPPPTSVADASGTTRAWAHTGPPRCRPPPAPPDPDGAELELAPILRMTRAADARPGAAFPSLPRGVASSPERWQSGRMHPP